MQVSEVPSWVGRIEAAIDRHYAQKLTLNKVSQLAGVHPMHLSRQFPKYFSLGFHYYIRKVKIEKATLLLAEDCPLYEIARRCGFTDPSHFNRCFRRIKGMNPSAYRKLIG